MYVLFIEDAETVFDANTLRGMNLCYVENSETDEWVVESTSFEKLENTVEDLIAHHSNNNEFVVSRDWSDLPFRLKEWVLESHDTFRIVITKKG